MKVSGRTSVRSGLHEPAEQDERDPRGIVRPSRLGLAFQIKGQLLPEEEILGR